MMVFLWSFWIYRGNYIAHLFFFFLYNLNFYVAVSCYERLLLHVNLSFWKIVFYLTQQSQRIIKIFAVPSVTSVVGISFLVEKAGKRREGVWEERRNQQPSYSFLSFGFIWWPNLSLLESHSFSQSPIISCFFQKSLDSLSINKYLVSTINVPDWREIKWWIKQTRSLFFQSLYSSGEKEQKTIIDVEGI